MASSAELKLRRYHTKRDFKKTPEPSGREVAEAGQRLVVQQHFAHRLHFDLRLEISGVLASWAVTRGPSANPKNKRLAVRTEDHPISYGSFEGIIPKPQYGGGTVLLWESCEYKPLNGSASEGLLKGHIKFECFGERMKGAWALIRMKTAEKSENWLLVKDRDNFAEPDDSIATRFMTGILSGLTRQQVERGEKVQPAKKPPKIKQESSIPEFMPPQLCKTAESVPAGDDWAFEMKYDGYRLIVAASAESVRVYTRSGLDWTDKFPKIVASIAALRLPPCLIDGEAVVFNAKGISDFPALVTALQTKRTGPIVFVAFDLLVADGEDIRKLSYLERKTRLQRLIPSSLATLRYGTHVENSGEQMFRSVTDAGGEGIIAKRKSAPYISERSASWLKIKGELRDDVLIIGFMSSGKHDGIASLLAAKEVNGELCFVGRIGTGYNQGNRPALSKLLADKIPDPPHLINAGMLPRGAKFILSPFGAEVQFGGWTADGQMRQARFLAIQNDRAPAAQNRARVQQKPLEIKSSEWRITHPDRILYPQDRISKGDVAQYYHNVKDLILPHLDNRPVSLLRVPESIEHEQFFQRHLLKGLTKEVKKFELTKEAYFALDGEIGLAAAVQFGTLEFHGWNAKLPNLDHPDCIIFDLDPDENMPSAKVESAAQLLRDYLSAAQLQSWPLLSGGKGIHVVIPLAGSNASLEVERFCKQFAKRLELDKPDLFVANMSIAKRKGKIFVDYLRNRAKATAIVPWSLRARPGATIAAPVSWDVLHMAKSAREYSIHKMPATDGWANFRKVKQKLSSKVLKLLEA